MKIKYLKIRNIASIDTGDIDFENGLTDLETGRPSALFLISGDTGSGKSVILDCISMALYGTTPRVKGVNGVKNNSYTNTEGEEISVNDIRQYTRIGISWKDDCYTQLTFIGNDGIEYTSTFSLGKTKYRNYRDPIWTLKIGDSAEIVNRKDEIKDRLQKAVGLTFEQFSRMAMLAQGQFANFLTGKKEERERILEQLTATDIFSKYGEAISIIYKRAKDDKELSGKLYDEFNKKILSEDNRRMLLSEYDEKKGVVSKLKIATEMLRDRIRHMESVLKAQKEISALETEERSLKTVQDSADFRQRSALISLWDNTEHQRKLLSDKLDASRKIASDVRTLQELKAEFLKLSEDLSNRKHMAHLHTQTLERERNWLDAKEPLRKIFEDSSVIILNIQTYINVLKENELKNKEIKEAIAIIENMQKEVSSRECAVKEKAISSAECQQIIKSKTEQRDSLKPGSLRKETEKLINRKHDLQSLARQLDEADSEKKDIEKARQDMAATAQLLEGLKEAADNAVAECRNAEKDMRNSEERYLTMHLSVDKNFRELRSKLSIGHSTHCPLCGQSITSLLDQWNSNGYFSGLLSPLEEEKKKLTEDFSKMKKLSDEAVSKMNSTEGSLITKDAELKKKEKSFAKTIADINAKINLLNLEDCENLTDVIQSSLMKIEAEITVISEKLADVDNIQKEIDQLLNRKEMIDKEYHDADKSLQKSVKNLTKKKESVRNAEVRTEELQLELRRLCDSITESLKGYADDWAAQPAACASLLKKDADEFSERSAIYAKDSNDHVALLQALDALTAIRENLEEKLKDFDPISETVVSLVPKTLKMDSLQSKWNDFLINVSTVLSRRTETETKFMAFDAELNKYYLATGTTETTIRQLLGAEKSVNDARIIQLKHREDLSKNSALLSEAKNSLKENLKALGVEADSQIEDVETVKSDLASYDKQYGELTQQLGVIKQKLDADEETRRQSELHRAELEKKSIRFDKWEKMYRYFGGSRFRTLVQSHLLRPLLNNANIYLRQITDHYTLTCSDENEQLSILVLDRYHNNEPRSVTVLSGGERFMISLALSLALSSMNRPDLNVDILFIDEGFGTLDAKSLEMVMSTLRRLPEINGQTGRRVGLISHREELAEQIPTQIQLHSSGKGRSKIIISNS